MFWKTGSFSCFTRIVCMVEDDFEQETNDLCGAVDEWFLESIMKRHVSCWKMCRSIKFSCCGRVIVCPVHGCEQVFFCFLPNSLTCLKLKKNLSQPCSLCYTPASCSLSYLSWMSRTLSSIWRLSCGDICPSSSEARRLAAACLASSISLRLAMISLLRALARFSCGGEFHS